MFSVSPRTGAAMPLDLTCPKCQHVFPVTEAREPVGVQCPACDAPLTAEFRRIPIPQPGESPYDLLVTTGRPPGNPPPVPSQGKKLALDEDEDGKKRKGGGMGLVIGVGLGALVVTLGGLGATGYFLFTNLDTEDTAGTGSRYSPSKNTNTRPGTNTNPRPGPGPGPFPGPGPDPFVPPPPPKKKADKFDLRPVSGPVPAISPPAILPTDNTTLELDLGGKVGAVSVAGGGRYIVVHIPERGLLGLYDANKGEMVAGGDVDRGDGVKLTGGLNRVVTFVEADGKKKLRSYSLPTLAHQYDVQMDMFFPPQAIAMGNRTDGPVLVNDPFGEVWLYELAAGSGKEIEGARKKPGIHAGAMKAFPDGTGFVTYDGRGEGTNKILNFDAGKRDWKVDNCSRTPFPSADGLLFGNGLVNDRSGRDARFVGISPGQNWLVPATTGGNYFMKVGSVQISAPPRPKKAFGISFHVGRNATAAAPGTTTLTGTPELNGFGDFDGNVNWNINPDQHFFLIPEAKTLAILNPERTKLTLRRIDLK